MAEIVLSSVLGSVAIVSVWATYWLNRRSRLQNELPTIYMEPRDHGYYPPNQVMTIYFKVTTQANSVGWRVTRVEVVQAPIRDCLRHGETGKGEWRHFDDFDHPLEPGEYGEMDVRPGCNYVVLKFLCERPRKRLWRKGFTKEKKWTGPLMTSWLLQE